MREQQPDFGGYHHYHHQAATIITAEEERHSSTSSLSSTSRASVDAPISDSPTTTQQLQMDSNMMDHLDQHQHHGWICGRSCRENRRRFSVIVRHFVRIDGDKGGQARLNDIPYLLTYIVHTSICICRSLWFGSLSIYPLINYIVVYLYTFNISDYICLPT